MIELILEPAFWASIALLIGLEVVLGADNVVFISLLAGKVPEAQRERVLRIGLALAALFRLILLAGVAWILGLSRPAFEILGWSPSWRELVLTAGGVFLIYKSVSELHALVEGEKVRPSRDGEQTLDARPLLVILQIVAINAVFSVDSIVTAIGVSPYVEAMAVAVVASTVILYFVANAMSRVIANHPSVEALALGFLLLVGMLLLARALGMEVVEPYLYGAFALAAAILAVIKLVRHFQTARLQPATSEEPKLEPVVETPAPAAPGAATADEVLVAEEVEDAPTAEEAAENPAANEVDETPVSDEAEDTPADDEAEEAPAVGEKTEDTPADDETEEAPADDEMEEAPAVVVVETDAGLGGTTPAVQQSRPLRAPIKRKIKRRPKPKKRREP